MRFLIKVALLLALGIFLMPVDEAALPVAPGARPVSTFEAMTAAQATVSDLSGFCGRNPSVCEVGGQVATTFAWKARAAAQMAYQYLDRKITEQNAGTTVALPPVRNRLQAVAYDPARDAARDPIADLLTGGLPASAPVAARPDANTPGQQTLTPTDRKIKWRGVTPQG